eukprot:8856257-Pyramimonas_sp.AAC.1
MADHWRFQHDARRAPAHDLPQDAGRPSARASWSGGHLRPEKGPRYNGRFCVYQCSCLLVRKGS